VKVSPGILKGTALPRPLHKGWLWLGIVAIVYLALALPVALFGRLTADEGWYLLASANVAAGQRPYRDFLFTQAPLVPYVYGAVLSVAGASLLSARIVSALMGLGGLLFATVAIQRRAGTLGAVLGGTLLALNLAVVFDATSFKTQALTLLLSGLAICLASGSGRWPEVLGSVAAMTLAVFTRLSMAPALICMWAFWIHASGPRGRVAWVAMATSLGFLTAGALFFWADGNALFGVYQFHDAYFAGMPTSGAFLWFFVKGFMANQLPIIAAGLSAIALVVWQRAKVGMSASPWAQDVSMLALLGASYASTTILHATRTVVYPTYQTSNVLFLVVFIGIVLGRVMRSRSMMRGLAVGALLIALAGMPWQEYVVNLGGITALSKVNEARAKLSTLPRGDGWLLTLSPELAVSSNLKLLPGYEMGTFSYFPGLDDARAKQLRVVNTAILERDLTTHRASVLALTTSAMHVLARGLGHRQLTELIVAHYDPVGRVQGYGQYQEDLYILAERRPADSPHALLR
jgi:hypothetical protein